MMSLPTASQIAALQAAYDAAETAKQELAVAIYGAYVPDQHALHTGVDENGDVVSLPVSDYSADLFSLSDKAAWKAALEVPATITPYSPGAMVSSIDDITPVPGNSLLYYMGDGDVAGLIELNSTILDFLYSGSGDEALTNLGISPSALAKSLLQGTTTAQMRATLEVGNGTGDLLGPNGATDGAFALFDGATGKLAKNSIAPTADVWSLLGSADKAAMKTFLDIGLSDGDVTGPDGAVDHCLAMFNGVTGKVIEDSGLAYDLLALKASNAALTANKVLYANANGKVVPYATIDVSKLAYLSDVTTNLGEWVGNKKNVSYIDGGSNVSSSSAWGSKSISFTAGKSFSTPPKVVVTCTSSGVNTPGFSIGSITSTGFLVYCSVANVPFNWIAIRT